MWKVGKMQLKFLFLFYLGIPIHPDSTTGTKMWCVNTSEHFPYVPRAVLLQVRIGKEFTRKNPCVKEFQFMHQRDRVSGEEKE